MFQMHFVIGVLESRFDHLMLDFDQSWQNFDQIIASGSCEELAKLLHWD